MCKNLVNWYFLKSLVKYLLKSNMYIIWMWMNWLIFYVGMMDIDKKYFLKKISKDILIRKYFYVYIMY